MFEGKALATALRNHGHQVSDKTVQRWKAGITHPKSQDMTAVRQLIAELLGHNEKAPEPEWVQGLREDVAEIRERLPAPSLLQPFVDAVGQLEVLLSQRAVESAGRTGLPAQDEEEQ